MSQIFFDKKPKDLLRNIAQLREQKGSESQTLELIESAINGGNELIIMLFFEEALTYQHLAMNEDSKDSGEVNHAMRKKALEHMENSILEAKNIIEKYKLTIWYSRMYRFLGRLYDYKKDYKKAIQAYKKAIFYIDEDPEVKDQKIPRQLEYQAFLAYSTIMSGKIEKGLSMSRKIYDDFDKTGQGKFLKKKNYYTWAVWKSGIPIRTIRALIKKKVKFDKKEMSVWLDEMEKDLIRKDLNLEYRKTELRSIRPLLSNN